MFHDGRFAFRGRRPARLLFVGIERSGVDALHDPAAFLGDSMEHRNRPQRTAQPLHEPEETGKARQVADDGIASLI